VPNFEIIGRITNRETIARGGGIRDVRKLRERYGDGDWRKCKGEVKVRLADGTIFDAEIHWYEAHGIGRRREKIKRILR
jgi:hypothetical protein